MWVKVQEADLTGFTAQGLTRLKSRCQLIWAPFRRPWGRICFQVHSGYWQNLFPMVVRLMSHFLAGY